MLSVLLCKSHILGNSCSSVIARKAFKGFYIARFSDHIYLLMERLDHIGTLIFFMWTDTCKRKNIQPNFLWSVVLRGFSRVALFLFTICHSKSSFPIRLQCLLLSWKFTRTTASLSLYFGRYSDEGTVKEMWDFRTGWSWCKTKILMMLSPSVKTTYLEIF